MAETTPSVIGSYDFYSPFASAAIITASGKRYPLTVSSDKVNKGSPLALTGLTASGAKSTELDFLPFLTQLSIELDFGMVPKITATLTPPFDFARAMLETDVFEWTQSQLEARIGFSAGRGDASGVVVSPTFKGLILKPDFSFGDDITVSFNAQGEGGFYLVTTAGGGNYPEGTIRSHITTMVQTIPNAEAVFDTDEETAALLDRTEAFVNPGSSYLASIYNFARRCGCYVYLDETGEGTTKKTKVIIRSLAKIIKGSPVAILALMTSFGNGIGPKANQGPASGVFPILTVSTENSGIFLDAGIKKLLQQYINPKDGKVSRDVLTPTGTKMPTTGKGAVAREDASTEASSVSVPTPPIDGAREEAAKALEAASTANGHIGIELDITTLGIPDIIPGMIVTVKGISKTRIDQNYIVKSVKHNYSSSGLETSLSLVQNALGIWSNLTAIKVAPNPNEQRAEANPNASANVTVTPKSQQGTEVRSRGMEQAE